jgi:hypothetical protein
MDSPSPSSDDLMTDYNIQMALDDGLNSNEGGKADSNDPTLFSPISSKAPLDKALKHMEALSLKQYHAQMDQFAHQDLLQTPNDPFRPESPNLPSTPFIRTPSPQIPSENTSHISIDAKETSQTSPGAISLTSPLWSLKLLGSEIDQSNSILQSFLKRAAAPNSEADAASSWSWPTSLVVTAPVVFGLVMDSLLG